MRTFSTAISAPSSAVAVITSLLFCVPASAHVTWTQVNSADPSALGIYHLNDDTFTTGSLLRVAPDMAVDRALVLGTPGTAFSSAATSVAPFFDSALRMNGPQRADSPRNFGYNNNGLDQVDKDATFECWVKWDAAPSASSFEIGFRSGAKLRITRDTTNPGSDQFGLAATHGTYVEAPGFVDWATVGAEEAPLDEWIHVAVTISSIGSFFDVPTHHHQYSTGSVARFYLNGHAVGSLPHTVSIANSLQLHAESSVLTIRNLSGSVTIDEVGLWGTDLSGDGANASPFANGRGAGNTLAADAPWSTYE